MRFGLTHTFFFKKIFGCAARRSRKPQAPSARQPKRIQLSIRYTIVYRNFGELEKARCGLAKLVIFEGATVAVMG